MKTNHPLTLLLLICSAAFMAPARAQSPTPLVVQAASPATAVGTAAAAALAPPAANSAFLAAAIRSLEEIKATDAETLKRQEATLEKLDELQKAADQLRIFAHRLGG